MVDHFNERVQEVGKKNSQEIIWQFMIAMKKNRAGYIWQWTMIGYFILGNQW